MSTTTTQPTPAPPNRRRKKPRHVAKIPPLLIGPDEFAELLGISRTMFFSLQERGRFPRPVQLSGRIWRWPLEHVQRWIHSGMPVGRVWEEQEQLRQNRK